MKLSAIFVVLFAFALGARAQYPEAAISNGIVEAKVYLPDAKNGFYRATRFDWTGVIPSLKYNGHEYFGQWYATHNPEHHDAIQGPVDAFDPIGYDSASVGDTFIKVGVGTLKKNNTNPYRFSTRFEIVDGGQWKVKSKKDRVEFTHLLNDGNGYGYRYKKTVRLVKGSPVLLLEHGLKNTGRRAIETNTFNHNFFMIDQQTTGPDFTVSLPFSITSDPAGKALMSFNGSKMNYLAELQKGQSTMEYPKGFSGDRVDEYDFRIENNKTGAGVRITADKPLSNFMFWSVPSTLSPEPFITVKADPGEEFKWTIKYEFYEVGSR